MIDTITYGIIAGNRISGSRMPRFLVVAFIEIQSERGPLVASPMNAPIQIAKLKKPIAWLEKLYRGAAKASLWVRFKVRNILADQETLKAANSTIGKDSSFQGIQKLANSFCGLRSSSCHNLNCCFDGYPFPSHGSVRSPLCQNILLIGRFGGLFELRCCIR